MGLDVYLYKGEEGIEKQSVKHPEHNLNKIGYFRSSYNNGGLNRVLENATGMTLYDVFPEANDKYEFTPNWKRSLKMVKEVVSLYKKALKKGDFRVMEVSPEILNKELKVPTSEQEALKVYLAEQEKHGGPDDWKNYSNAAGEFHHDGLEIVGLVRGISQFKDSPVHYVVVKGSDEDSNFYLEGLEIVQETIEWVLSQKKPEEYSLHWSA